MKAILLLLISASAMIAQQADREGSIFDKSGQMIGYRSKMGRQQSYEYDSQGRMTKYIDEDGRVWKFQYNDDGSITKTLPDGSTVIIPKGK